MSAIRGYILYRRNRWTREMRKGQRVFDIASGFVTYTTKCFTTRGGWVRRDIKPDVWPPTNGYVP